MSFLENKKDTIDKEQADPDILRSYEDLRNERWSRSVQACLVYTLLALVAVTVVVAIIVPHPNHLVVWGITVAILVVGLGAFALMARLSPHAHRKKAWTWFLSSAVVLIGAFVLGVILSSHGI